MLIHLVQLVEDVPVDTSKRYQQPVDVLGVGVYTGSANANGMSARYILPRSLRTADVRPNTHDTDANSMKHASEMIKKTNAQILANLKAAPKTESAKEAGTPPDNELDEFLANLDQINSSIVQLKTYVNESKKKEL